MAQHGLHRSWFCIALASLCLTAALLAFPNFTPAVQAGACETGGQLGADTTWGPAICDPYIVTADIYIPENITLTLLPGTTLKFAPGRSLLVQGGLKAQGSESRPVRFTSNAANPARGDWGGIFFGPNNLGAAFDGAGNYTGGSILQYALIEYAGAPIPGNSHLDGAVVVDGVLCGANAPYIDHATVQYSLKSGIISYGQIRITHSIITNNGTAPLPASSIPSGITTWDCYDLIQDNTVTGNAANGIFSFAPFAIAQHVLVERNTVTNNLGNGIYVYNGSVTNNTVSGNRAGGIMYQDNDGSNVIEGNVVVNNTTDATRVGAGIWVNGSSMYLAVRGNIIKNNTALADGGGIYVDSALMNQLEITGNIIAENSAGGSGGGIYVGGSGMYTIAGNTITGNSAVVSGGGLYGVCAGIYDNQILDNRVDPVKGKGGGIFLPAYCHPNINRNDIFHNTAFQGANIYNQSMTANAPAIDATGNFWLTPDSAAIGRSIYDHDDFSQYTVVNFTPFSAQPINFTWKPVYLPLVRK